MKCALDPTIWPVIPTDLTLGAWAALEGATSKATLEFRWSSLALRCWRIGISLMILLVNVEKSSALCLDAETTKNFNWGSTKSFHTTNAEVIQDLPTPLKACMISLFGPDCRYSPMSYCIGVGLGNAKCFHARYKKFLKSPLILSICGII